ncbi:uncharacterized protein CLUP02_13804 [Colletotrichum lupini]|uniref:Uncharacterized protein n=1 Tax=Colletotrichum lupini TaxID=145971 RepID=A0A9Q8WM38_9PEZI|nr:uncharacterized protein CLUP02_13804 [Colletotrichum lupini]UQC88281.1 hypothetical protein CLUP02_13804 [Colletotrichum lupini]
MSQTSPVSASFYVFMPTSAVRLGIPGLAHTRLAATTGDKLSETTRPCSVEFHAFFLKTRAINGKESNLWDPWGKSESSSCCLDDGSGGSWMYGGAASFQNQVHQTISNPDLSFGIAIVAMSSICIGIRSLHLLLDHAVFKSRMARSSGFSFVIVAKFSGLDAVEFLMIYPMTPAERCIGRREAPPVTRATGPVGTENSHV